MLDPKIAKAITALPCPGVVDLSHIPEKDRPTNVEIRRKAYSLGYTLSIKNDMQRFYIFRIN
jgi:hypothetical protein